MGRAIAMQKQLDEFKDRIKIVEDALSTVIDVVESMQDKGQRTTHVDLVDDVPSEVEEVVEEKAKSKKSNEKAKRLKKD